MFFMCNVVFVAADIVSDILTASEFFNRGDYYWGLFTTLLIFAPFMAKIVLMALNTWKCFFRAVPGDYTTLYDLIFNRIKYSKNDARIAVRCMEAKRLIWQFPLLHPFR